ncbi:MAG: hypothetical protein QXQ64_08310 [Candidatus Bathyarchaeia archaeon]
MEVILSLKTIRRSCPSPILTVFPVIIISVALKGDMPALGVREAFNPGMPVASLKKDIFTGIFNTFPALFNTSTVT